MGPLRVGSRGGTNRVGCYQESRNTKVLRPKLRGRRVASDEAS